MVIGAGLDLSSFPLSTFSLSSFLSSFSSTFLSSFSSASTLISGSELTSVRAVDGALSICPSFSFSESSVVAESTEDSDSWLLVLLVLRLLAVLVRCRDTFPVCGGEARLGETSCMHLRKSRYATGGVMGVF